MTHDVIRALAFDLSQLFWKSASVNMDDKETFVEIDLQSLDGRADLTETRQNGLSCVSLRTSCAIGLVVVCAITCSTLFYFFGLQTRSAHADQELLLSTTSST